MSRPRKKWLWVLAVGTIALLALAPPIFHLIRTAHRDRTVVERLSPGFADDVSRPDQTRVAEIWDIPSDPQRGEDQLRAVLPEAQALDGEYKKFLAAHPD